MTLQAYISLPNIYVWWVTTKVKEPNIAKNNGKDKKGIKKIDEVMLIP